MSLRAFRRMSLAKASILFFGVAALAATALMLGIGKSLAKPASPTDETKVPHYFGPYPNWANSPLTLPDATVTVNGDGSGAKAEATVGGNGAITGITITDPGTGYTAATVDITSPGGAGSGATATATVNATGVVTAVVVTAQGSGYTKPTVSFAGGGAATQATATAYGEVGDVAITNGGSGYSQNVTVDFDMPDDPNGVQATGTVTLTNGVVTGVTIVNPGSGYASAPGVAIIDGTRYAPVANGGTGATATATMKIKSVTVDTFGSGYTSPPDVTINDPTGTGATATATVDAGAVTKIDVTNAGTGYVTGGGTKKFTDPLPVLCDPANGGCPTAPGTKYLPIAVPDTSSYTGADTYEIGLVQFRVKFSSSLPASLVRGYVQLETAANTGISQHFPLVNEKLDGTSTPVLLPNGQQAYGVTAPQYLGPTILATKDRPVRVVFRNLLPTGADGNLFLPVDTTIMGSGDGPDMNMTAMDQGSVMDEVRNPMCGEPGAKPAACYTENRATLHLHGGITPWISDGTPHQWITPANEQTSYPKGVTVSNVPDMPNPGDGAMTFFYTNQQSARLMFYHDHSWGITRLNVYAGEAAPYLITDDVEKKLVGDGTIPAAADTIPLVIQDKTFVPKATQLSKQDPTWDATRWGGEGNLWYHHVYMPAQNPGDPSGMSAFGRWMYGPWFWPPAKDAVHGPIDNPYYDPNCDPATAPNGFCEPKKIPGTPNISAGMEQFNDTPIVNGTAYPDTSVDPKTYRFRILNAANDRFWNLQWYVADPTTGTLSEVALKPAELAAAQTDPTVSPTPDTTVSPVGPSWIQIGTEGGFLPAPVVVPNQPITWITDPTRFDFGNVDKHSLLLAPAERADVIVDFSKYAGKTLILYNDAPAAFPARVPLYDYYTGNPDMTPVGAPSTLPGYGPNTRTIMRVTVTNTTAAPTFNLAALQSAFKHHADGSGVFEKGQHPIIVGQAPYNSAYGTSFTNSGWCNAPGSTSTKCDGYARINEQGGDLFGFNTLANPGAKKQIKLEPKALHDEMNASSFDEFGRMTANLGLEAVPATPGLQNVILYPFVNPSTELIDGTNLPKGDTKVQPIGTADDGTQIWKITHNGVDTHPIHFHLYDVQIINRVTWDNIIIPPDATELGWKDTIRVSPLEDTIVALRPIIPATPFEIPNSIRELNPMMPDGSTAMFNNIDPQGNPTTAITNRLVNFGWEYMYHCHILSHEEMDMMRPVSLALPPIPPDGLTVGVDTATATPRFSVTWNDKSITETAFVLQRSTDGGATWTNVATSPSPLNQPNTNTGTRTEVDTGSSVSNSYQYRVVAENTVGYGGAFPSMTVKSVSAAVTAQAIAPPAAPSNLAAVIGNSVDLTWSDNSTDEQSFVIERSQNGGVFVQLTTVSANTTAYRDATEVAGYSYKYRVKAVNLGGSSAWSNEASISIPLPAPSNLTAVALSATSVRLNWVDNSTTETSFQIQRANGLNATAGWTTVGTVGANVTTWTDTGLEQNNPFSYRVCAVNAGGSSPWSNTASLTMPIAGLNVPGNLVATALSTTSVRLTWTDTSTTETGFQIQRGNGAIPSTWSTVATVGANITTWTSTGLTAGTTYSYRIRAVNAIGSSGWSNTATVTTPVAGIPAAPSSLRMVTRTGTSITLAWNDNSNNEQGFYIQRRALNSATWNRVGTVGANVRQWTNSGLARNTFYVYRVQAYNAAGASPFSNQLTTATLP